MATKYYFSSTLGDDSRLSLEARNPNTPWKTLDKFNQISGNLSAADTILFLRGDKFFGQLLLKKSGTAQKPIVITAYGIGEAPEIHGWIQLKPTESVSETINRYDLTDIKLSPTQAIKTVYVNGELKEKGRYPNEEYLIYNTTENDQSITYRNSSELAQFAMAEIVLRMNEWIFDKARIINVSPHGISFKKETNYNPTNQYGFFIQDHFNTLDRHGEWFHEAETNSLFVYIDKPNELETSVKISTVDHLLTNETRIKHVMVEGINFSGSTKSAIFFEDSEYISIRNCTIESAGEDGIKVINVPHITISGNSISNTFENGVFLRYGTPNAIIVNNKISNINLYAGMGKSGDQTGIGIYSRSDSTYIANNVLRQIGYSGIFFGGNGTVVEQNIVDGYCLIKNDGGGIYTYEGQRNLSYQNRIIRSNTIINGKGTRKGNKFSNSITHPQVEGIYIDDNASGIEISNNKIGSVSRNGINLHNAREIIINKNTVFDCANLLSFSHDNLGDPISKIKVSENRLIAIGDNQKSIKLTSKLANLLDDIIFEDNVYHHPTTNDFIFQVNDSNLSLKEWSKYEPSYKSIILKSKVVTKTKFEDLKSISQNLLGESRRQIHALNSNCRVETGTNPITVTTNEPMSGVRIKLDSVKISKNYILKIVAKAESDIIVQAYLRTAGSPWATVSEIQAFKISNINQEKFLQFSNVLPTIDPVLMLKVENKNAKISISELYWTESNSSKSTPTIFLKFNDSDFLEAIHFEENVFLFEN